MPTGETAAEQYFRSRAASYRDDSERGLWRWLRDREAKAVLTLSGSPVRLSVLDLGCGAGYYARLMARQGAAAVIAVDACREMIDQVGDAAAETLTGDVATIRLQRRFDLVLLAGVLEFVDDPAAALITAREHLASGGRVILLLPPSTLAGQLYRLFHRSHGVAIGLFDRRRLQSLAATARLRLVAARSIHPYALACALEPA